MEFMNLWSQKDFDKGIKQGLQQGVAENVLHQLNIKIGAIGLRTQAQIKKLSAPKLRDLSAALLNFSTRTDLTSWLKNNG